MRVAEARGDTGTRMEVAGRRHQRLIGGAVGAAGTTVALGASLLAYVGLGEVSFLVSEADLEARAAVSIQDRLRSLPIAGEGPPVPPLLQPTDTSTDTSAFRSGPTPNGSLNALLNCAGFESGYVRGIIKGRFEDEEPFDVVPMASAVVLLEIRDLNDAPLLKSWTRTGSYGEFLFRNVPDGVYRLFAVHGAIRGFVHEFAPGRVADTSNRCLTPDDLQHAPLLWRNWRALRGAGLAEE
ncbi:MAG: hypothetical protein HY704_17035 [Gemmatimonadetes bacterium]|nr:hypothetical protein [Gemmatimonadota bacterium]